MDNGYVVKDQLITFFHGIKMHFKIKKRADRKFKNMTDVHDF